MNSLTPQLRFLTGPLAGEHQKWSRSDAAKAAIEAALAEMALTINDEDLPKLAGAKKFANLLINLAEVEAPRKKTESSNLKYQTEIRHAA